MQEIKISDFLPYLYDLIIIAAAGTFIDTEYYFLIVVFCLITFYLLFTEKPYYFKKINLNLIKSGGLLICLSNPFMDFTLFWLLLSYIVYLILINDKRIKSIKLKKQKYGEIIQKYLSGAISFVIITILTAGFSLFPLIFQFLVNQA